MKKIAVIGSNGQLGSDIVNLLDSTKVILIKHNDLEITGKDSVDRFFNNVKAEAVINTAAFHKVPECENQPAKAFAVNSIGPYNLALICETLNIPLVHISTDYVFDGKKTTPYVETDPPNPLNIYGISKLAGEYAVLSYCSKGIVIRTSGLYGLNPCRAKGGNFIDLMLKLASEKKEIKVVSDEILTPTYTVDLARQILKILDYGKFGLFNATAEGQCSWFDFAKKIFYFANISVAVIPVSSSEFPTTVKRPQYSVLENYELNNLGINIMRPWESALEEYISERKMHREQ